jgi:putative transposase
MARTARASRGGYCYHVLNRGNRRAQVFHDEDDYAAFVRLLRRACARYPMRLLSYCLMPNHFHLALWPLHDGDLSDWMQWLLTAHVARHQRRYQTTGHIWQGRFRAFPIQEDEHLLMVLRYIERNPVRAALVARAEDWRWSSAHLFGQPGDLPMLDPGPVPRPDDWLVHVNQALHEGDLKHLRRCVRREAPYGSNDWVERTAQALGLEASLRPPGRPRRQARAGASDGPAGPLFPE